MSHYVALWAVVAGAVGAFAGFEVAMNRGRALEAARDDLAASARLAGEHAALQLEAARARRVPGSPIDTGAMPAWHALRAAPDRDAGLDRGVAIQVARQSRARMGEPFAVPARAGDDRLQPPAEDALWSASAPVRESDEESLPAPAVVEPLRVLGSFPSARFAERARIGLARRDGTVLVAYGAPDDAEVDDNVRALAGHGLRPAALEADLRSGARRDGLARLVALYPVPGTSLSAFATVAEATALAGHARFARDMTVFAALSLVALTLPLGMAARRALGEVQHRRSLELRYAEEHRRARSDSLTGVGNRVAFDTQLERCNRGLAMEGTPFVLAIIDIDRFKALNDSQGHVSGDDALRRIARTLAMSVRSSDVVARLGGDEFAVLMPGANAESSPRVCGKLHAALLAAAATADLPIGFSIGVVAFEDVPAEPRMITALADRLMYDVKSAGGEGVRYGVYRRDGLHLPDAP